MLFTTSIIWQYPEVYEDETQEWIELMQRENES